MKHEKIWTAFWSMGMSFLLAYGAVGALATGFGMTFDRWVPLALAGIAGICGLCWILFSGIPVALGLLAIGWGYIWRKGNLISQTEILLHRIFRCFHSAYGWPVPEWVRENEMGSIDLPLILLGSVIVLIISWAVCRKRAVWWGHVCRHCRWHCVPW